MEPPAALIPSFVALARHVPLVVMSPLGVVLAATEAAERALGCRSAAMVGRAWSELCADPPPRIQEFLEQCARTLAPIPGAFHRQIGEASIRFRCEGYAATLPDNLTRAVILQVRRQDKQDTFIMLGQKIAELNSEILRRKESEQRLAGAQSRLTAILDQMPAGVLIAEAPSGHVTYSNRQAREIFGGPIAPYQVSDGTPVFTAWHADGREYLADDLPLVKALHGEVIVGEEVHFRRVDGRSAVIRVNAAPILDENGALVAAVTAYYDVTDQKRLAQLTESARAEAETATRAKDEFLAMLGHELRNPLAPILTALDLMQLRGVGAEKERNIIERQVKHVVRLVDDLLDISRFVSGKIELRREPVELAAIVARAVEMASPLLEGRQHRLGVEVARGSLVVEGDAARLAQVVCNLLTNAAKYSERGGSIWITGEREDGEVVLKVRDSGIGIAAEILPRIFDRFVQEKQALDRSQGGLGLGLAIVHSLVQLHGGTVTAHSEGLGHGSLFIVRLPAVAARPAAAKEPFGVESRGPVTQPLCFRVLVVDDNQDGAEMLSQTLVAMGHSTRVAHDGPTALDMVKDFVPQLALVDIGLPVMDGYELAQRLRQEPGLGGIRIVAVTGYGQESDRARSRSAGFDAHLVKPVRLDQLASMVRELLA